MGHERNGLEQGAMGGGGLGSMAGELLGNQTLQGLECHHGASGSTHRPVLKQVCGRALHADGEVVSLESPDGPCVRVFVAQAAGRGLKAQQPPLVTRPD